MAEIYEEVFGKYKGSKDTFIETGTFMGTQIHTTLRLGFNRVKSVEASKKHYKICMGDFRHNPKVTLYHGFSEDKLGEMMKDVKEPALIFLDAHKNSWFKGGTLPLEQEIDILSKHPIKNHTIIVDDFRLYGGKENISETILEKINPDYNIEADPRRNGILIFYP